MMVCGATVNAARRFFSGYRTDDTWDDAIALLTPPQRALVEQPTDRSNWVEQRLYSEMLETFTGRLFSDQDRTGTMLQLGEYVMADRLDGVGSTFLRFARPNWAIRASGLIWSKFFRGGALHILKSTKTHVHVAVEGTDRCCRPYCESVAGGMIATLKRSRANNVTWTKHRCIETNRSLRRCEYAFDWR